MITKPRKMILLVTFSLSSASAEIVQAEDLGYLFTSAAQRETLNTVRDQYQRGLYKEGGEGVSQLGYKFNGVVSKHGQAKALWVNGSSASTTHSRPNNSGEYRVDLPLGQIKLKPGQIYQPASASVIEAFDKGGSHEGN